MIRRVAGMTGERKREWEQFARWCVAADLPELPADASTVLAYLADDPDAAVGTRRARASAINEAHRREGLPVPGEAEAVRQALNPGRAERMTGYRARIDQVLPRLDIDGWPAGLSGRRDAVIMLLAAAGLSWRRIATLPQRDVHIADHAVVIGTRLRRGGREIVPVPLGELAATDDPATCPVVTFMRWAQLLAVAPPATGHIRLERILTGAEEPAPVLRPEYADLPLITGFDRRGFPLGLPGELDPLAADTITAIAIAHLAAPHPLVPGGDLDPNYYERGLAARARAREIGEDLDALFARIDAMVDRLPAADPLRSATTCTAESE